MRDCVDVSKDPCALERNSLQQAALVSFTFIQPVYYPFRLYKLLYGYVHVLMLSPQGQSTTGVHFVKARSCFTSSNTTLREMAHLKP